MWVPSRPTAASAGSQARRRKFVLDRAKPSGLVNARTPGGTERRCLRRSGTIRSAKSTTRRPARDFGGPNTGTAPALLSWRVTRTVQASKDDVFRARRHQLSPAEARERGERDQRPVAQSDRKGVRSCLISG